VKTKKLGGTTTQTKISAHMRSLGNLLQRCCVEDVFRFILFKKDNLCVPMMQQKMLASLIEINFGNAVCGHRNYQTILGRHALSCDGNYLCRVTILAHVDCILKTQSK
jgi:hypothetical protein